MGFHVEEPVRVGVADDLTPNINSEFAIAT